MIRLGWRTGAVWLAVMLLALPAAVAAQTTGERMHRLAILSPLGGERTRAVLLELERFGFREGRNLVVDERIGDGPAMPQLARDAVAARPDAMIAIGEPALRAARAATDTVPIVAYGNDPIEMGMAATLARPGGNVTGVIFAGSAELDGKRLDLLNEAVPQARRVGALLPRSSRNPQAIERALRSVATARGIDLLIFDADGPEHYDAAFAAMRAAQIQALVIAGNAAFLRDAAPLAAHAIAARVPTACQWASMAHAGCMLGYGPSLSTMRQRVASFVARIFSGAAPGDLPIETPTAFDFVLNLRTARTIGVVISQVMIVRADEVIE